MIGILRYKGLDRSLLRRAKGLDVGLPADDSRRWSLGTSRQDNQCKDRQKRAFHGRRVSLASQAAHLLLTEGVSVEKVPQLMLVGL